MGLIVQAFWTEPTGRERRWFRCYQTRPSDDPTCRGYCNAMKLQGDFEEELDEEGMRSAGDASKFPWDAFPQACEVCGRAFDAAERQIFASRIYVAVTGARAGEEFDDRSFPVGAMRDCEWLKDMPAYRGADGIALEVRLPDGSWLPDSRASNCTLPDDDAHKCWCRHGDPRTGYCHVDKDGLTCAAGGGSIQMTKFHGFLHRGFVCEDRAEVDRMIDAGNPVAPAERVLTPVQADVIRVRRATPAARETRACPVAHPGVRRWRSNR